MAIGKQLSVTIADGLVLPGCVLLHAERCGRAEGITPRKTTQETLEPLLRDIGTDPACWSTIGCLILGAVFPGPKIGTLLRNLFTGGP